MQQRKLHGPFLTLLVFLGAISRCNTLRTSLTSAALPKEPPKQQINVGLILPHTNFGVREYNRARSSAIALLHKSRGPRFKWLEKYSFTAKNIPNVLMLLTPSPTGSSEGQRAFLTSYPMEEKGESKKDHPLATKKKDVRKRANELPSLSASCDPTTPAGLHMIVTRPTKAKLRYFKTPAARRYGEGIKERPAER
ncbi:Nmdar2 [Trypoxylus dichotomus]